MALKKAFNISAVILIAGFAVWLFSYDEAAEPGPLSSAHQEMGECGNCHIPWRGVKDRMCLGCHEFSDVSALDPRIRFHEAEKHCLGCHTEHNGQGADISEVDHTLFNGELLCTQCHFDPHDGLFSEDCRECHGLTAWEVPGFRHPPAERRNCNRCHRPPRSHLEPQFWSKIEEEHLKKEERPPEISPQECLLCHTTHRWSHLKMGHL